MKILLYLTLLLAPLAAWGGEADVVDVKVVKSDKTTYRFDVTLRHDDRGWEHYADKWEILGPDGSILATRVLYHPHIDEQPFTRSLGSIGIPPEVDRVKVRGHDSVHGYGGTTMTIQVP